jgi:NAD(P)-dependent dehydrogenase (short-subunit alcohol dehydrogenase family)
MKLSGKVAIVTGAGSGIGRAAALSLARRGVALVIVNRNRERLAETAQLVQPRAGGFAEIVAGDVTDEAVRGPAIETARRRLGRLDILVNNAGNVRAGRLDKIDVSEMISANRERPAEVDERFRGLKARLGEAVAGDRAL